MGSDGTTLVMMRAPYDIPWKERERTHASRASARGRCRNARDAFETFRTERTSRTPAKGAKHSPFSIFPSRQRLCQTERLISFPVGQCGAHPDHVISSVDLQWSPTENLAQPRLGLVQDSLGISLALFKLGQPLLKFVDRLVGRPLIKC